MDAPGPPLFLIPLFPVAFAGMWCAVSLLLSRMGGWSHMAEKFPAHDQPSGKRFYMQGGRIGVVQYSGCLTLHLSPEGTHLAVLFPFRLGHPPLFIPWEAVHRARIQRFLWSETVVLEVGSPVITTLQLPKKIFAEQAFLFTSADAAPSGP